jgi:hypothetical protein
MNVSITAYFLNNLSYFNFEAFEMDCDSGKFLVSYEICIIRNQFTGVTDRAGDGECFKSI